MKTKSKKLPGVGALTEMANLVRRSGRGGDNHLIHINDAELRELKGLWGNPGHNPQTGLPEYSWLSSTLKKAKNVIHKVDPIAKLTDQVVGKGVNAVQAKLGDALRSDNPLSVVARIGQLGQKYTDPLYHLLPKKYYADPLVKAADKSNELFGKLAKPAVALDKKINPARRFIKPLDKLQTWTESKPLDTAALAAGAFFGGSALAGGGGEAGASGVEGISEAPVGGLEAGASGAQALPGAVAMGAPESVATLAPVVVTAPADLGGVVGGLGALGGAGLEMIPTSAPEATASANNGSLLDRAWTYAKDPEHWSQILAGARAIDAAVDQFGGGGNGGGSAPVGGGTPSSLPPTPPLNRRAQFDDPSSYYTYGESGGGERQFFMNQAPQETEPQLPPEEVPWMGSETLLPDWTNYARGGTPLVSGPGTGRSDEVPARLSAGEYVMDAETVALLGDGSTDAGARKLDEMRKRLRQHKGQQLVKGRFSQNAKNPEHYLSRK